MKPSKDGAWNRKWDRRMKQREKLVETSARLDFYVKLYLKKRNAGYEAILRYLDEAGMGYVQSRRLMREKGFDRADEEENRVDEVVEGIRKSEIARGRVWWRVFPVRIRNGEKRFLARSRGAGNKRKLAVVTALLYVLRFVYQN
jgi:hypothetical protein